MKKIEAIIREEKLPEVKEALEQLGVCGMTVYDVKGRGKQKGISLQWRVGEYRIEFLPKKLLMLVVNDQLCQKIVDLICDTCNTGTAGDGKIFISTVDEVITIRNRTTGELAI
ncbi:MAG TPA: P-II family nitrogen regulator [Bacillota bacterium]|nr:P-II family nitrogen regulator [Bacillota bacterium]